MAASSSVPVSSRAWRVLWIAGIAQLLPAISISLMYVLMPELAKAFPGSSSAGRSWVLNGYTILSAATLVPCGVLTDRTGRKRAMVFGLGAFITGATISALAPSITLIVVGRLFVAIGSSLIIPASTALALREFPPERRASAFGALASFGGIAAAAGPSIGALLMRWGGWRWAFWINVPIGVVALVLAVLVFDESRDEEPRPIPDLIGALCVTVAVGFAVLSLIQSPAWGWLDPRTMSILTIAIGAAVLLIVRSRRHPAPIIDLGLFRSRTFSALSVATFVVGVSWFGMYYVLVQFLRGPWGYGLIGAGLLVTPIPFGAGVLGPVGGRLADRMGYRPLLMGGAISFGLAAVWFITMIGSNRNVPVWLVGIVLVAIATGLLFPSVQGGTVVGVSPEQYGIASSLNQMIQRVGSAIGNALAVVFMTAGTLAALDRIFVVVLLSSVIALAAATSLPRHPGLRVAAAVG
jgi:EmrB/QacA subfamily drug resistance transporter